MQFSLLSGRLAGCLSFVAELDARIHRSKISLELFEVGLPKQPTQFGNVNPTVSSRPAWTWRGDLGLSSEIARWKFELLLVKVKPAETHFAERHFAETHLAETHLADCRDALC